MSASAYTSISASIDASANVRAYGSTNARAYVTVDNSTDDSTNAGAYAGMNASAYTSTNYSGFGDKVWVQASSLISFLRLRRYQRQRRQNRTLDRW